MPPLMNSGLTGQIPVEPWTHQNGKESCRKDSFIETSEARQPIKDTRPYIWEMKFTGLTSMPPMASSSSPDELSSPAANGNSGFRFFVVDHPDSLKDKKEMRANRQHVMHNHIRNSRKGTNLGISSASSTTKRRRLDSGHDLPKPINDFNNGQSVMSLDNGMALASDSATSSEESHAEVKLRHSPANGHGHQHGNVTLQDVRSAAGLEDLLYTLVGRHGTLTLYLATPIDQVPFIETRLGTNLNPFNTWPEFCNSAVDIERLKLNCHRRFGCRAMSEKWVPALMQARHAFYSTLCISATHDDIMKAGVEGPDLDGLSQSLQTMAVRQGVIQMIKESLKDSKHRTSDGTIIAILHVMVSEVMSSNRQAARTHQKGLEGIIKLRGGIDKLGSEGQVADILMIAHYLTAILWEESPHEIYAQHANQMSTNPEGNVDAFPESPIYCTPDYADIRRSIDPSSNLLELLELVRDMSEEFMSQHDKTYGPVPTKPLPQNVSNAKLLTLYNRIFSFVPESLHADASLIQRIYDAVRLAARLFAHALLHRKPFSEAASELAQDTEAGSAEPPKAICVQIKQALVRTELDNCWVHLAGVLYWVAFVGGAGANAEPLHGSLEEHQLSSTDPSMLEGEQARRWLTAEAVRCMVLLSFEHGRATLGTMKRMIELQAMLADGGKERVAIGEDPRSSDVAREAEEEVLLTNGQGDVMGQLGTDMALWPDTLQDAGDYEGDWSQWLGEMGDESSLL